jgi:hypothetical protein
MDRWVNRNLRTRLQSGDTMKSSYDTLWIAIATTLIACAKTHDGLSTDAAGASRNTSNRTEYTSHGAAGTEAVDMGAQVSGNLGDSKSLAVNGPAGRDAGIGATNAAIARTAVQPQAGAGAPGTSNDGKPEVWIGQLWSVAPSLCDSNAPPPSSPTPLIVEPEGHLDRVVLILEYDAQGQLAGRIRFGEDPMPANSDHKPYAAGDNSYEICGFDKPTKGADYTVLEPVLTSNRLMFTISPTEVWTTWCQKQDSACPGGGCPADMAPCTCAGAACKLASRGRLSIDLAVTADTIEGQLPFGGAFGTPDELRLRRAQ